MPLDDDDVTTANKLSAKIAIPFVKKPVKVWNLMLGVILACVLIVWLFL